MPILYFVGGILLTLNYWGDKYILLRMSSRSNKIDATMNDRICDSLTIMGWFHAFISLIMLTSPNLFNPYDISSPNGMKTKRNHESL